MRQLAFPTNGVPCKKELEFNIGENNHASIFLSTYSLTHKHMQQTPKVSRFLTEVGAHMCARRWRYEGD